MQCQSPSCQKSAIAGRWCAYHTGKRSGSIITIGSPKTEPTKQVKRVRQPVKTSPPTARCTFLGCDKAAVKLSGEAQLCSAHYSQVQPSRCKPRTAAKPRAARRLCEVDGCDGEVKTGGLCNKHAARLSRAGSVELDPSRRRKSRAVEPRLCSIDGCEAKHSGRGYCASHHRRLMLYGDPLGQPPPKRRGPRTCTVDGCDAEYLATGLCRGHYAERWEDVARHTDGPRCASQGCERVARKRGLCASHYESDRRARLRADPDAPRCVESGCREAAITAGRCIPHYRARSRTAAAA